MAKNSPLSDTVMYQARQMYEEKDERGKRLYSMMEIAAKLGVSETSVYRAVKNMGRFANLQNAPLPQARNEQMWAEEAQSSQSTFLSGLSPEMIEQARALGQARTDGNKEEEARLAKMQKDIAAAKAERIPGQTKADKMLEEMKGPAVSQEVKDRAKEYLG